MQATKEQAMAYKEVYEILKYIPEEDLIKIPKQKRDFFKYNMDLDYDFKVNTEVGFEQQNISEKTKVIIAILFRDYWANDLQKKKILNKERYDKINKQKKQDTLKETYNYDDLFRNKKNISLESNSLQIVEYKEPVLIIILKKIKKLFLKFNKKF